MSQPSAFLAFVAGLDAEQQHVLARFGRHWPKRAPVGPRNGRRAPPPSLNEDFELEESAALADRLLATLTTPPATPLTPGPAVEGVAELTPIMTTESEWSTTQDSEMSRPDVVQPGPLDDPFVSSEHTPGSEGTSGTAENLDSFSTAPDFQSTPPPREPADGFAPVGRRRVAELLFGRREVVEEVEEIRVPKMVRIKAGLKRLVGKVGLRKPLRLEA